MLPPAVAMSVSKILGSWEAGGSFPVAPHEFLCNNGRYRENGRYNHRLMDFCWWLWSAEQEALKHSFSYLVNSIDIVLVYILSS